MSGPQLVSLWGARNEMSFCEKFRKHDPRERLECAKNYLLYLEKVIQEHMIGAPELIVGCNKGKRARILLTIKQLLPLPSGKEVAIMLEFMQRIIETGDPNTSNSVIMLDAIESVLVLLLCPPGVEEMREDEYLAIINVVNSSDKYLKHITVIKEKIIWLEHVSRKIYVESEVKKALEKITPAAASKP